MEIRDHIENIIQNTFKAIDEVYKNNKNPKAEPENAKNGRLVFPNYRDKSIVRVSEQELRFIFVDQFINYCKENCGVFDYYYSVEVSTDYVYSFPHDNNEAPKVSKTNDEGKQSASIDMAIYKRASTRPVAIIEFKKDGCSAHEIAKDFLKLSVEPGGDEVLRFFIIISSSDTRLHKISKNGTNTKISGLLKSFLDKFDEDCFCFDNSFDNNEELNWNTIDIRWHRLPFDGEPQRNGNKEPIDSNDFTASFNYKGIGGNENLKIVTKPSIDELTRLAEANNFKK